MLLGFWCGALVLSLSLVARLSLLLVVLGFWLLLVVALAFLV